jgi:hypothetical protein
MQQFARVLTENGVIPVILRGDEHLDLCPIVSDITPDAIASGALKAVDIAGLSPVRGPFNYLAPINGLRQISATGFNYKKHIEEFKMKPPAEPEVFLKGGHLADRAQRSDLSRTESGNEAGLGSGVDGRGRTRSAGHHCRGGA